MSIISFVDNALSLVIDFCRIYRPANISDAFIFRTQNTSDVVNFGTNGKMYRATLLKVAQIAKITPYHGTIFWDNI